MDDLQTRSSIDYLEKAQFLDATFNINVYVPTEESENKKIIPVQVAVITRIPESILCVVVKIKDPPEGTSRYKVIKMSDLEDISETGDIGVIMKTCRCSKRVATESYLNNTGDLLSSILDISKKGPDYVNESQVNSDDLDLVTRQCNCTRDVAVDALLKYKGDLLSAILHITGSGDE